MQRLEPDFALGQCVRFDVDRLFGRSEFTYRIPLPNHQKPIRFLSAPNGFGKSTTLRLINDLSKLRWDRVAGVVFDKLAISFDCGTCLSIGRAPQTRGTTTLSFVLTRPYKKDVTDEVTVGPSEARSFGGRASEIKSRTRRLLHRLPYVHDATWRHRLPNDATSRSPGEPDDFESTLDPVIEAVLKRIVVDYIDTERLVTTIRRELRRQANSDVGRKERPLLAIEDLSYLVNELVTSSRFAAGQSSGKAERSFPVRILNALDTLDPAKAPSLEALANRYTVLRTKEQELQSLALVDDVMTAFPAEFLTEHKTHDAAISVVLKEMLDGIEARLSLLDPVAQRLMIFRRTLNDMLEGKEVRYLANDNPVWRAEAHRGFEVVDRHHGSAIPLRGLSSGEQHLIVMFGRILFQRRPHTGRLILIDEPEISLHPEWQILLSQSLKEVTALNGCFMLLATHSPTMIGDDWEDEMDLSASGGCK
jgi:hypothetical protein